MALPRRFLLLALILLTGTAQAVGTPAPFDLSGPTLEVKVSRGGKDLPASQVPNLAAGDKLWIKADLPPTQSAHYLLVAAFLSGATNPPPFPTIGAGTGANSTVPVGTNGNPIFSGVP